MKAIDLITIEEAKAHLSIDRGYNGDDALIEDKLETAFAIVLSEASQAAEALLDDDGKLDRIARAATLLKLGDLYAYRESHYNGSVSAIGDYQRLISLIRNYT